MIDKNLNTRIVLIEKKYFTLEIKSDVNFGGWWLCEENRGKKFKTTITTSEIAEELGYHGFNEMETLYLTIADNPKEQFIIRKIFCK